MTQSKQVSETICKKRAKMVKKIIQKKNTHFELTKSYIIPECDVKVMIGNKANGN